MGVRNLASGETLDYSGGDGELLYLNTQIDDKIVKFTVIIVIH